MITYHALFMYELNLKYEMKIIKHIPQKAIDKSFYILVQSDIER